MFQIDFTQSQGVQMNISVFKNELSGGGARNNLFRVQGTFPAAAVAAAGLNPSNQIQFLCHAASLPQVTIGVTQNTYFQGRHLKLAGDRSFDTWVINVYNDNNFALRNAFEKWHDVINRVESNIGRNGLATYAQQWTVTQLDREGRDIKTYTFIDCWPSMIGAIELDFTPTTNVETFPVNLEYQYYQMEGTSS